MARTREAVAQWLREGDAVLRDHASALDERSVRGPSLLTGWTRAHVLAHLALNAEALGRLAHWARTGEETPMYAGPAQRDRDIEAAAGRGLDRLRADLSEASAALDTALGALTEDQWRREVRSAQGRPLPATDIPWFRVREAWLHTVDLDTGLTLADVPADVVEALLDDVTATFGTRADVPSLELTATDRARSWPVRPGDDPVKVRGTAADLLGWLTGRSAPDALTASGPAGPPALPPWL